MESIACRPYSRSAHQAGADSVKRNRNGIMLLDAALLAAVVLTLVAGALTLSARASSVVAAPAWRSVQVPANATLWDLAEAHPVAGHGTAETVAMIREHNGLADATIIAGQSLELPVIAESASTASRF